MTSPNGSHPAAEAIAQAEADARAHQDAHPPVTPPPAAEKPRALTPPSLDWLDVQIAAQEQVAEAAMARFTASDLYQRYMQEVGYLNGLKRQREFLAQQQAKAQDGQA